MDIEGEGTGEGRWEEIVERRMTFGIKGESEGVGMKRKQETGGRSW